MKIKLQHHGSAPELEIATSISIVESWILQPPTFECFKSTFECYFDGNFSNPKCVHRENWRVLTENQKQHTHTKKTCRNKILKLDPSVFCQNVLAGAADLRNAFSAGGLMDQHELLGGLVLSLKNGVKPMAKRLSTKQIIWLQQQGIGKTFQFNHGTWKIEQKNSYQIELSCHQTCLSFVGLFSTPTCGFPNFRKFNGPLNGPIDQPSYLHHFAVQNSSPSWEGWT